MNQWEFLLATDSAANFPKVLVFMILFLAGAVILGFLEYKLRRKWIWITANALLCAFAVVVFLISGAGLSEVLLYLLAFLFVRLCFVMWEGRNKT